MFDVRLRKYTEAGVRGQVIPTLELDSTDAESATSTLTFSTSARIAERMEAPFVVGIEYTTGSSWSVPRNNLYVVLEDAENAADQTDVMKFTAQSYVGWLLSNALHWWNTDGDGNSRTYDMTPGRLIRQLVTEAKGTTAGVVRGWAPMLTTSFSDTADSLGQAWTADDQIKMEVDLWRPYSALFQTWIEQGHFEWWAEGTTLMLARLGTGADLTSKVVLGGPGFDSAPAKTDFKGTFTTLVLIPDKANATHAINAGADTRFGALETSMSMSGVTDPAAAVRMAQPVMKESRAKKLELSFDWTPAVGGPKPWADFTVGDLVVARRKVGKLSQRVVGIQVSKRDGVVSARAIVGSKLVGLQAKLAKRVGSTTNGGIIGGSGAGVPFNPGVKRPDPIAPSGLMVTSAAYFDATGTSYASVTATCGTVTTDVLGGTVKVKWYELWGKKNSSGESWARLSTTEVEPPSMTYTGLLGGESWSFKVRAYVEDRIVSAFSPVFSLVLANDTTAPATPAPPTGTTQLGQVLISHSGLTATGTAQPIDFSHFNVWMATTSSGTGSKVGQLQGVPDTFPAPQQPYDQARWFWVTAQDKSGNISAPSTRISVTTRSVVPADITQEAMDAITEIVSQDVVSSIGGTVTWSANAPVVGDGSGKPVGALWYQRDGSNNVIGMWEWSGSAWSPRLFADATLANLNAGKINAGFLDAARIQANTITASKIAIGDFTNLVNGCDFEDDAKIPFVLTTGFTTAGDTFHTGARSLRIAAGATTRIAATGNYDVQAGEQYYAVLWARRSGTYNGTSADSKLSVRIPGLGLIGAIPYGVADIPTANTWTELKTTFTVPAGASTKMFFDVRGDHTAGDVRLDDIIIRRMNAGELIVDGAIIASKLATNSVESNKIAANAITADKINAGAITTVKLAALAITSEKIAANAITTSELTADAITSKHTITGARFRTTATPSRGIDINSLGLTMYNSAGQPTVIMDASNGNATFTGTIRNKISGPRVSISSGDAAATIYFYGSSEGGSILPAQISSDPNGQSLFLYGGNPDIASPIYTVLRLNERTSPISWLLGRSGFDSVAYPRIRGDESTASYWERSTGHRLTLDPNGWTYVVGNGLSIAGGLTVSGAKSFAMDHPTKPGMTLTHASTESPYNGVEYWSDGLVEMPAQGFKTVTLPAYFEALTAADHRVAILTAGSPDAGLWYEPIANGKFIVHGTPGALFSWGVKARRVQIVDGLDVLAFQTESTTVDAIAPTEPDKEMSIET